MAKRATSVAMVFIILGIMSFGISVADADATFVARTCKKTKNALLCMSVLHMDPKSTYASIELELANIALKIAGDTAKHNAKVIKDLAKEKKGTPEGGVLNVCVWSYQFGGHDLEVNVRTLLHDGDYVTASSLVLDVKGVGDHCENAFKGLEKKSPVTNIDREMTERCGVAAELIALLIHK
ncbi:hypothetical protein ACQJBY_020271 [Aegilops geniculata]